MRLQLVGEYTIDEFIEAVSTIAEYFREHKVDAIQDLNIYLSTSIDGYNVNLTQGEEVVDHLKFDFSPTQKAFNFLNAASVVESHTTCPIMENEK